MSGIVIKAKKRANGKKATKAVRYEGMIPGVFYAKGKEPISIATTHKHLKPAVYTSDTHIIQLEVEGEAPLDCILQDVTFDPVTDEIVHFDLLGIIEGQTLHVEVPVLLKGNARGVTIGGGMLEHITHKIRVECFPNALPEHIELDVTPLEVGKSLHASDIKIPGVKVLVKADTVIAAVHHKKVRDEAAAQA